MPRYRQPHAPIVGNAQGVQRHAVRSRIASAEPQRQRRADLKKLRQCVWLERLPRLRQLAQFRASPQRAQHLVVLVPRQPFNYRWREICATRDGFPDRALIVAAEGQQCAARCGGVRRHSRADIVIAVRCQPLEQCGWASEVLCDALTEFPVIGGGNCLEDIVGAIWVRQC